MLRAASVTLYMFILFKWFFISLSKRLMHHMKIKIIKIYLEKKRNRYGTGQWTCPFIAMILWWPQTYSIFFSWNILTKCIYNKKSCSLLTLAIWLSSTSLTSHTMPSRFDIFGKMSIHCLQGKVYLLPELVSVITTSWQNHIDSLPPWPSVMGRSSLSKAPMMQDSSLPKFWADNVKLSVCPL